MLTAMIMLCALNSPNDCMEFKDTRGPYHTHEQCTARVEEMINTIVPLMPGPVKIFYQCKKEDSI